MPTDSSWLQWQLIDSAFPAGAFAHSSGLEAAVQLGMVNDTEALTNFVRTSLRQSAAFAVPFALAVRKDVGRFAELNDLHDAMLTNDVANRASRAQGKALIMAASEIWPGAGLGAMRAALRSSDVKGHLCVCFGLLASALPLEAREAAETFLFIQARGVLSAAVRLAVLGTLEAQRLQASLTADYQQAVELALNTPVEQAAQTAPLIDLLQAQHDRLYSRLFLS